MRFRRSNLKYGEDAPSSYQCMRIRMRAERLVLAARKLQTEAQRQRSERDSLTWEEHLSRAL
ncbi:hypothetical protein [Longimicrobium sp.]|uniref:hypothetical protein n=1 Tax=Longimicrobium sp. TaxID=2029185 RepID=UPI002E351785|nr:hypothetical protein [Longimicrobium sp.]